MRSRVKLAAWVGAVTLATFTVACGNTGDGLKEDAAENSERAEEAAADARESASEAADKAENALDRAAEATAAAGRAAGDAAATAGRATGDVPGTVGSSVDAATQTIDVKAALMADKSVDASGINVDIDRDSRTVTLKGHVPTAMQKTRAGEIASAQAPGYKIDNRLDVRK